VDASKVGAPQMLFFLPAATVGGTGPCLGRQGRAGGETTPRSPPGLAGGMRDDDEHVAMTVFPLLRRREEPTLERRRR